MAIDTFPDVRVIDILGQRLLEERQDPDQRRVTQDALVLVHISAIVAAIQFQIALGAHIEEVPFGAHLIVFCVVLEVHLTAL